MPDGMDFGTKQILITGALGWLGRNLVETLIFGLNEVDTLKAPPSDLKIKCLIMPGQDGTPLQAISDRIRIVVGDLRQPVGCRQFVSGAAGAVLFHTAALIHPRRISDLYRTNVDGTRNLLDAAADEGLRRAVVVSSNSPIGVHTDRNHLFDEQSPYRPYMNYGRSKMLMEQAVQEVYSEGRMETVIIRPTWFYGPHQPPRQTLFFEMIRDGKMPIVGDGDNRRSMAYVENICQGLLLAALHEPANGQIYWIADERPYTLNEIVDTVERLLEEEFGARCLHRRLRLPGLAGTVATLADYTIQCLGLYHQKMHVLSEMNKNIACTIKKAQTELGYAPTVELEEGMRRSVRWLNEKHHVTF